MDAMQDEKRRKQPFNDQRRSLGMRREASGSAAREQMGTGEERLERSRLLGSQSGCQRAAPTEVAQTTDNLIEQGVDGQQPPVKGQ
jgi:hypothetical protein